jgi:cytochrome d ubiquinol oxidase subunit I
MVGLGMLFALLGIIAWLKRKSPENSPWLLKILIYCIPLPYLAASLGWTVTEVGRQPWIVYGIMKTADAASPVSASQVGVSLLAFAVVYTVLGIVCFYLITKNARKGPKPLSSIAQ